MENGEDNGKLEVADCLGLDDVGLRPAEQHLVRGCVGFHSGFGGFWRIDRGADSTLPLVILPENIYGIGHKIRIHPSSTM